MSKEMDKIVENLTTFPGIGPRQARRIGFFLANLSEIELDELASSISSLRKLKRCSLCFRISDVDSGGLCNICSDKNRNHRLVAVVEKETDLSTLEKAGKFKGRYLVLGSLNREGILTQKHKTRLKNLKDLDEVIIALSPTTYGDVNALAVELEIKNQSNSNNWRITRLGRGIPTGAELEFADEETLEGALENRK